MGVDETRRARVKSSTHPERRRMQLTLSSSGSTALTLSIDALVFIWLGRTKHGRLRVQGLRQGLRHLEPAPTLPLHEQVLARVLAAQHHAVVLFQSSPHWAAGMADAALQVLLHFAQRVGQGALDGFEDALALDPHRGAGALFVPCEQRSDHRHRGAKPDAFGDAAMGAYAAVGALA